MVSVQDLYEAKQALKGGADIVDVKNLQEALVGSAHPNVVKEIRDEVPSAHHASVTLGVVPNQIGTVSMAVYAAGILDATSVKVGFMVSEYDVALETLLAAKEALIGTQTKLIGSLFADNLLYDGGIDPDLMVQLAKEGQCDGFLIDTLVKDGRNLFDFVPEDRLKEMVLEGKELGMSTALSGHLKMSDLDELSRVNPDIVGVRGAVCQKGDRDSRVHWESVSEFKKQLDLRQTGEIDVYPENRTSSVNQESNGWIIIDGTGKTCAGIIATLSEQINADTASFVEVIIPDVLNTYDLIVWAEKNSHDIVTQRKDAEGSVRMLIKP
jgi:hypothetical protein|tara:strand:+ start:22202 stop:23176 length:975 start_codon:yes stop_codon:yes gene_type:complete